MAYQIGVTRDNWKPVYEKTGLAETDQNLLWGRQFLNSFACEGLKREKPKLAKLFTGLREIIEIKRQDIAILPF